MGWAGGETTKANFNCEANDRGEANKRRGCHVHTVDHVRANYAV